MTIRVVDYDPEWRSTFLDLRDRYETALREAGTPWKAIEHVGSTSVEGLAAKPVVDIDIVVEAGDVTAAAAALEAIGFEPLGDLGVEDRWAFLAPADLPRTNTYVVVEGSLALRNHLGTRQVLQDDPDLCRRYALIKKELAASVEDIDTYVAGKSEILSTILERAGLSPDERAIIRQVNGIS